MQCQVIKSVSSPSPLLPLRHHSGRSVPQFLHPRHVESDGWQRGRHCVHGSSRRQRPNLPVLQQHQHQLLPARSTMWLPLQDHCIGFIRPVQRDEKSNLQDKHGYIHLHLFSVRHIFRNLFWRTVFFRRGSHFLGLNNIVTFYKNHCIWDVNQNQDCIRIHSDRWSYSQ